MRPTVTESMRKVLPPSLCLYDTPRSPIDVLGLDDDALLPLERLERSMLSPRHRSPHLLRSLTRPSSLTPYDSTSTGRGDIG